MCDKINMTPLSDNNLSVLWRLLEKSFDDGIDRIGSASRRQYAQKNWEPYMQASIQLHT